jgi:hypothetical protein
MSYRCQVCRDVVGNYKKRLYHVVHRVVQAKTEMVLTDDYNGRKRYTQVAHPRRTEIAREYSICEVCKSYLNEGISLNRLMTMMAKKRQENADKKVQKLVKKSEYVDPHINKPVDVSAMKSALISPEQIKRLEETLRNGALSGNTSQLPADVPAKTPVKKQEAAPKKKAHQSKPRSTKKPKDA